MTDKIIIFEILISAGFFFALVWLIKFSILFSGVRSLGAHSFLRSILQNFTRGLVEFIETVSRKEKFVGKKYTILELLSVLLGLCAGVVAIHHKGLDTSSIHTFNVAVVAFIYISLCFIEFQSRSWKNIDLIFLFYLKSFLMLLGIAVTSALLPVENTFLHIVDFILLTLAVILFFKEIHSFVESGKEASLIEVNLVTVMIIISSTFLMENTIFNLENYFLELSLTLILGVFFYSFTLAWGQLSRLVSLEKKIDSWLIIVVVWVVVRLGLWII